MKNVLIASSALLLLLTGMAHAEDTVSCGGSVTSKQGEGLVFKSFRFEVSEVAGSDMNDVLEKCKKVVQQRQNRAGRANPALGFRKFSDLDLDCTQGTRKFQVRRTLQTGS